MNSRPATPILVRLSSELSVKARGTRRRFTRRLIDNIHDALRRNGGEGTVSDQWSRLLVTTALPGAAQLLARIPGISSVSPVEGRCGAELAEIVRVGVESYAERVRGRSYAVRVRRSGPHPYTSQELERELGTALNPGARVDLRNPEVEIGVEVRDQRAYLFSERIPGIGGLPLGVEGRAVCLLSGGFDSAVAAWLMLKRGVELDYVFCNLAGEAYEHSVVRLAKLLDEQWSHGTRPRLHVVDFAEVVDELRRHTQPKYWQLLLKRQMYRAASQIAIATDASAVITGECIGQVSSQTLANLAALEGASAVPVFRPLLGFDKEEIIQRSREIGTYPISARVREYCAIAPGNPVTDASPRATLREESRVDAGVVRARTAERRVLELHRINAADLIDAYLFTEQLPDHAVVVDLRPAPEWARWHYPGSVRRDPWELAQHPRSLDRGATYVLCCDAGMQAAVVAEQLQRDGIEAYALRGGTRTLRALEESAVTP